MTWNEFSLGDVVELQRGFDLPNQNRANGNVPIISSSGCSGFHNEPRVEPPGVVTGRYGTIGSVFYVREPFWPLNTTLFVKNFRGNDPRFVYYLLHTIDFDSCSDKSGVPGVNRNDLHRILVGLPPLDEQRAIAEVLGALDDKIELNRQMNHTLEEMASALFKSWFVDFDPVVAKAEGRLPFGMDAETAALFPAAMNGDSPQGWRWSAIGDEVAICGGSTPSTSIAAFWGGPHHWCTPRDISKLADPIVLDTERCITDAGVAEITSGLLPPGTVLLSSRAPIGYTAIAHVPLAINQGFIAMVCDRALPNHFVLWWTRWNMNEIESRAGGTTFAEISKAAFRPIPTIVPSSDVLGAFRERVEPWHELRVASVLESRTLTSLRDALLPKLLSGEIRLKQAEKMVEAAL